jgi:hypothetical protein
MFRKLSMQKCPKNIDKNPFKSAGDLNGSLNFKIIAVQIAPW